MAKPDALLEAKFNNLCSHYKDTYDIHLSSIKQRDILFYALLLILSFFSLQTYSFNFANSIITDFLSKQIGVGIDKRSILLSTVLWFLLFGITIKYYQVVLLIEKQYAYLHGLEEMLNNYYRNTIAFTREGKAYLSNYPTLSSWVCFIYSFVFPVLIVYCVYLRIIDEINFSQNFYPYVFINFIIYILIATSSILYLVKIHFESLNKLWNKIVSIFS
jgi:hypothetical protein